MINKCLPCHAETVGHREEFDLSQLTTPTPYFLWLLLALTLFQEQVLYLNLLDSLGGGKNLSLSLLGLG